jgi:uncharacterized membrane protein
MKDVGLPIYPGARPHKDKDNDTPVLVKRDPLQSLMIGLARAGVRRESSP